MGQGATGQGVQIRDGNANPERFATVTAGNSLQVSPESGATWTVGLPTVTLGFNGVKSVSNVESLILAASARREAFIQNHGSTVLQLHFTAGQAFGAGPVQLAAGESYNAAQTNGVYQGNIYGIRAAATENVGVVEES